MTVSFCGHKDVYDTSKVKLWLTSVIRELIELGVTEFYSGGMGGFDRLVALVLKELKAEFPEIKSILVLAYLRDNPYIADYDSSIYPGLETVPQRFAISKRNEWMVAESDILVAYVIFNTGGAVKTTNYAKRKKKRIIQYGES